MSMQETEYLESKINDLMTENAKIDKFNQENEEKL
jgi:hypothetical protein